MKRVSFLILVVILIFLYEVNVYFVNFLSEVSLYNFAVNLILAVTISVFLLIFIKAELFVKEKILTSFFLSQGIIFYFLLSSPRLSDKLVLIEFYISGLFISSVRKKRSNFILITLFFVLSFVVELSGYIFFNKNFLFLNLLKKIVVTNAGYVAGVIAFKNR